MAHADELGVEFGEEVFGNKEAINKGLAFDLPEIDCQLDLQLVVLRSKFACAIWTEAPVPVNEYTIYKVALVTKVPANDLALVFQAISEPKCGGGHEKPNV